MRPDLSTVATEPGRKCHRCGRLLTKDHYSMQEDQSPASDWFCNQCRVETSPYRFLRLLADRPDWMDHPYRGCSPRALAEEGLTPEAFFPDTQEKLFEAVWLPLCGPCPVKAKCGLYGSQTGAVGVWGGTYRGGLETPGIYRPGKYLLAAGKCKHGHKISSLDDIRVKRDGSGRVSGGCLQCYLEYQAGRRKNSVRSAA